MKFLDEVKAREKAATPAPWMCGNDHLTTGSYDIIKDHARDHMKNVHIAYIPHRMPYAHQLNQGAEKDLQFFLHARTDIPRLLRIIEKLRLTYSRNHEHRPEEMPAPGECIKCDTLAYDGAEGE